jgi:hypothetical protein
MALRTVTALVALAVLAPAAAAQAPPGNSGQSVYEEVEVGGTVPGVLSLVLGDAASFGAFAPGTDATYRTTLAGSVTSTAGDAVLSVFDRSSVATGRLVNGSYALTQPLQVAASSGAGFGRGPYPVGSSAQPTAVLVYLSPTSNDQVTIAFAQTIAASESLRTGSYGKTLTFSLTTSNP